MAIALPPRPPSDDELEALIREARNRQRRRQLFLAAGVAIAGALALVAYAVAVAGTPTNSGASRPGAGVAVTACRPSQLAASIVFHGGITAGGYFGVATIRNTGAGPCVFLANANPPRVQISWHGKPRPLRQVAFRPPDHRPVRLLRPDAKAAIWLVWENWCASPHLPPGRGGLAQGRPQMIFAFNFGRHLTITAPYVGAPTCLNPSGASYLQASRPVQA
jgi:hypothetical protein